MRGPGGRRASVTVVVAMAILALTAIAFARFIPDGYPGPQGDGTAITPVGQLVTPAGSQIKLEEHPYGMALSPDGAHLLVSNAGVDTQSVMLVDVASQEIVDEIAYDVPESSTLGVAFSPDGSHAYVSAGPNNKVRAYAVDDSNLTELAPVELKTKDAWPSGISVSKDGQRLYVAGEIANALLMVDLRSGEETAVRLSSRTCPALDQGFDDTNGRGCNFSYATTLSHDESTVYVSNWGKKSVSVVDSGSAELIKTLRVGTHPSALALNPMNDELYVANTDSDSISVIDTAENKVVRSFSVSPYPGAPVGTSPNALAVSPDGHKLYVANAGNNDVAVVELGEEGGGPDRVEGLIPTAWYPTGVAVSPDGEGLFVVNAKGLGAGPNPGGPVPTEDPESPPGQYIGSMIEGTLSTIPIPGEERLIEYTEQVAVNNSFDKGLEKAAGVLENIKHVIYVINENRTYDQVLGDLPRGNGDPSLTLFGPDVAPNHHNLAEQFTTLDNLYAAGEVSNDGWEWSTAASANTFNQKSWPTNYGGRGFLYTGEGYSLAAAPGRVPENSYIWDALSRKGISFRNYGFWATDTPPVDVWNEPNLEAHTDKQFPGYNLAIRDQFRYREWLSEFRGFVARGNMPAVQFVKFPNDHTCGTDPACPTPQAMVADSDWATGKLVDKVSHSRFWKSTAIFQIEDDAQDGPDHVDAHRTIGHVISPYTQVGEVDSTFYSSVSMLRTMEMIMGLSPLTQFDAAANPMLNSFTTKPDFTPYEAVKPKQSLNEPNPENGPMAKQSSEMDFSVEDQAPWQALNRAIWKSVHGGDSIMPAPEHNLPIEEEEEE